MDAGRRGLRLRQLDPRRGPAGRLRPGVRLPGLRPGLHPAAVLRGQGPVPLGRALRRPEGHRRHRPRRARPVPRQRPPAQVDPRRRENRIAFQGLPARICWLGYGERDKAGLAFNDLVAHRRGAAPRSSSAATTSTAGSVASPYRETESMLDGSDAIADWPLLNALVNTASGASLGVDPPRRRGRHRPLDPRRPGLASPTAPTLAAQKLARVLTNDPGMGVIRHVDAGYDLADQRGAGARRPRPDARVLTPRPSRTTSGCSGVEEGQYLAHEAVRVGRVHLVAGVEGDRAAVRQRSRRARRRARPARSCSGPRPPPGCPPPPLPRSTATTRRGRRSRAAPAPPPASRSPARPPAAAVGSAGAGAASRRPRAPAAGPGRGGPRPPAGPRARPASARPGRPARRRSPRAPRAGRRRLGPCRRSSRPPATRSNHDRAGRPPPPRGWSRAMPATTSHDRAVSPVPGSSTTGTPPPAAGPGCSTTDSTTDPQVDLAPPGHVTRGR